VTTWTGQHTKAASQALCGVLPWSSTVLEGCCAGAAQFGSKKTLLLHGQATLFNSYSMETT
jgi:hypothetical protein